MATVVCNDGSEKKVFNESPLVDFAALSKLRLPNDFGRTTSQLVAEAQNVLAVVGRQNVTLVTNNTWRLTVPSVGEYYAAGNKPLCSTVELAKQPRGATCTAFLLNNADRLITAAHCLDEGGNLAAAEAALANYWFVTSYWNSLVPGSAINGDRTSLYSGVSILHFVRDPKTGDDWAEIKLDRAVRGAQPFKGSVSGEFQRNQAYHVFGFPFGVPMMFAYEGADAKPAQGLLVSIPMSTFGGNSGSPIISSATGQVAGVLVSVNDGSDNVVASAQDMSCFEPTPCQTQDSTCAGENVMTLSRMGATPEAEGSK